MLNNEICHSTCWKLLNVVERKYTLALFRSTSCRLLPFVERRQPTVFRVSCHGAWWKDQHGGGRLGLWSKVMAGLLGGDCASCLHLLTWRMIASVSNWGSSFKGTSSGNFCKLILWFLPVFNQQGYNCRRTVNVPTEVLLFFKAISSSNFPFSFFAQHQLSQHRAITTFHGPPFSKCGVVAQQKWMRIQQVATSLNICYSTKVERCWTVYHSL